MKKWSILLGFLILLSCETRRDRTVNPEEFENQLTDSSILYFKNVRQLYYDKTVHEPSKMEQYRFGDRVQDDSKPIVNLCIVLNILTDRAYVMVEPNDFFGETEEIVVRWENPETAETGTYVLGKDSMPRHFQFTTQLYNALQKKWKLSVEVGGKHHPFLTEENEREAFRITMYDYFRLVNAL